MEVEEHQKSRYQQQADSEYKILTEINSAKRSKISKEARIWTWWKCKRIQASDSSIESSFCFEIRHIALLT